MGLEDDVKRVKKAGYWLEIIIDPDGVFCAIWSKPDYEGMQIKISEANGRAVAATVKRAAKGIKGQESNSRGRTK